MKAHRALIHGHEDELLIEGHAPSCGTGFKVTLHFMDGDKTEPKLFTTLSEAIKCAEWYRQKIQERSGCYLPTTCIEVQVDAIERNALHDPDCRALYGDVMTGKVKVHHYDP